MQQLPTIGLYLHIPFCRQICHYCDFAKTALYSDATEDAYWRWLSEHLDVWLTAWQRWGYPVQFSTVFLGGGTPSLYTRRWSALFDQFEPYLTADAEITMEANPDDCTMANLKAWQTLGINRLSLGVQSFQPAGLQQLTRTHSPQTGHQAIDRAASVIGNVNCDLIYGWPGQTPQMWRDDINSALQAGVCHLSLYNLTFEPGTVLGRRYHRGRMSATAEDDLAHFYELACHLLAEYGFEHQEVSNWARAGYACRHNWCYWSDQPYLGLGTGAHSYLKPENWPWGLRFSFPKRLQAVLQKKRSPCYDDMNSLLESLPVSIEAERTSEAWLLETISCGLRSKLGIKPQALARQTNSVFQPRPAIQRGLSEGSLIWSAADDSLWLRPAEWFRETSWSLEVALSFLPQHAT
jgi:oxygen-independent coproporphyrinogen-3 oxidase